MSQEVTLQKYRGTLSLLGPAIDDLALSSLRQSQDSSSTPNFSIPHQQRDRDREQFPFHITFLTKDELRNLSPENQKRVHALLRSPSPSSSSGLNADLDTNNIFSLGIGSFSAVYWTVIIWASGQKLRKLLSLPPKHFHITLSSGPDIHDPPLGKGVDSLITPLDFSFLSSSSSSSSPSSLDVKTTAKIYDDLPTTHLDHLTFTLHLFHSHTLSQQCATALILRDEAEAAGGYKGFLRYADACWALKKYKLAMLAYGCVWERVAFILRIQKRKEKRMKMKMRELETEGGSTDNNNDVVVKDDEEVKAHTKIQAYVLKKLGECARHTEWGHVFRSDEVEDVLSPHPLLHDDVRAGLMRVWGEELRSAIRVLVDKRGVRARAGEEDMGNENNPRTALFIPVFTSSTYQDQNHKQEEKKKQKRKFEFYRLPRFFSWVVPFHLALMSTPKSHADVRALASSALGIRRVVTLTEEERLPGTWFGYRGKGEGERERDIVNTFIPVKNECPPSIEQMDCVVRYFMQDMDGDEEEEQVDDEYGDGDDEEEEDQDGWHYYLNQNERGKNKKRKKKKRNTPMLIHCGGGKGRAGTVAACYLVSFGFGPPPHPANTSEKESTASPKMPSQAAITALRALRPGSLETSIQERFVSEWASAIWKRRSVFPPSGEEEPLPLVAAGAFGLNVEVEGSLSDFTTSGSAGGVEDPDPMLIILVGLPGAGKSWFAKALMARDPTRWVYVSQDEIGSREVCERVVARGPLLPRGVNVSISGTLPRTTPSQTQTSPRSGTRTSAVTRNTSRSTSRPRGLILDRCNPTSTDRKTWISLAKTWTDRVLYVHFDYPPELCVSRAQRRVEHPTLQPGGRVRAAVKAVGDVFEAPGVEGKGKGVRAIVRVRSFAGAREAVVLVDGLGRRAGGGGGGGGVVMKFPRTPHLMDLGGAGGDDVWVEGGVDGFMRGASPRVLESSSASAAVEATTESCIMEMGVNQVGDIEEGEEEEQAEDGILSPGSVVSRPPVASTTTSTPTSTSITQTQRTQTRTQTRRRKTVITEKLDGANMGLSLSPDGRTILVQNRSHYITSNTHAQFKKLDAWLARCGQGMRRVLLWSDVDAEGWFPDRWILYGEWLAARHSVGYDNLEDWFVAFDLYDRVGGVGRKGGFVDGETMRRRCAVGGIVCAPVLFDSAGQGGGDVLREEELVRLVQERSVCGEERREGVVVKIEEWDGEGEEVGWVKARGKIVRGDFIAGNEHWTKGQLVYNKLREE